MKRVVFLCTENANRSQMAEAFARRLGAGVLEAWSAGSRPAGEIHPKAVAAMAEKGYDLSRQRSAATDELPPGPFDYVISMGCGDLCPHLEGGRREDWGLVDPRPLPAAEYARVRDEIERRVRRLVADLGQGELRDELEGATDVETR